LFIPSPFAAQYYYQGTHGPTASTDDQMLKDMIKKQMYEFSLNYRTNLSDQCGNFGNCAPKFTLQQLIFAYNLKNCALDNLIHSLKSILNYFSFVVISTFANHC